MVMLPLAPLPRRPAPELQGLSQLRGLRRLGLQLSSSKLNYVGGPPSSLFCIGYCLWFSLGWYIQPTPPQLPPVCSRG